MQKEVVDTKGLKGNVINIAVGEKQSVRSL